MAELPMSPNKGLKSTPIKPPRNAQGFMKQMGYRLNKLCKSSSSVEEALVVKDVSGKGHAKPGWKAMPYIVGNEAFERLGTFGLSANFTVYLRKVFHMDQVQAANTITNWSAAGSLTPLIGAFISDAYSGRFRMIVFGSFAAFLGMVLMTLTAGLPQLHPAQCSVNQQQVDLSHCERHTPMQFGVLICALVLLSLGTGGIKPCCIPFGVDQFDATTVEGRRGINSYFNVFYALTTIVLMLSVTVVVYIQERNWALGFGIPSFLMLCSIVLLFAGTRVYVYLQPEGSLFSNIAQTFVAAFKKRNLKVPVITEMMDDVFYDPPPRPYVVTKLTLKKEFRWLNKAAIVMENELKSDGTPTNPWRLCSIQQVEEVKCLLRIVPIWLSTIIVVAAMAQQGIFSVSQALKMDRYIFNFQIPAGSIILISYITVALWLPLYDRILVPSLEKFTGHEGGVTMMQRLGIGAVFAASSVMVAGFVERKRRDLAGLYPSPDGVSPMSVLWLGPQLVLMGFYDAFFLIGQIEFYNKQFPDEMRSIGNAMPSLTYSVANMAATLIVNVVHRVTGKDGHEDWLTDNINKGRIDNFYFFLTGLSLLNCVYFVFVSRRYRYKGT